MFKKIVTSKPAIMIVERDLEAKCERTCDICGKPITTSFWKMYWNTLENPKHDGCIDICQDCYQDGAYLDKYPQEKFSEIAFKKFVNPNEEICYDPEYDYYGCSWFDDDPEVEHVKSEHNESVTNFIEFVKKTAESLGILKNQGRYQWR